MNVGFWTNLGSKESLLGPEPKLHCVNFFFSSKIRKTWFSPVFGEKGKAKRKIGPEPNLQMAKLGPEPNLSDMLVYVYVYIYIFVYIYTHISMPVLFILLPCIARIWLGLGHKYH